MPDTRRAFRCALTLLKDYPACYSVDAVLAATENTSGHSRRRITGAIVLWHLRATGALDGQAIVAEARAFLQERL